MVALVNHAMTIALARAKWLVEYHAVTGKYMLKSKGKNYRASAAAYMLFLSVLLPQYSRRYKLIFMMKHL